MSAAVALAAGWTDENPVALVNYCSASPTIAGGLSATVTNTFDTNAGWTTTQAIYRPYGWWMYPQDYYRPWYVPATIYEGVSRIRLKSSEVDRLRTAAKRDAKLKAVLEKLTPCIEVEIEL